MNLFQRAEELRKRLNQQLEERGAFGTAAIIAALQEQDKITRHACAEELNRAERFPFGEGHLLIKLSEAQAFCINVKTE